ncbi:MAG: hypothetical protein ACM3QS_16900 [Bacteroidota bacterium]
MNSLPTLTQPATYRIRIAGRVNHGWSDFLTGLQETHPRDGETSVTELTGTVPDQPALFGLLCHIRDLGLPLISVEYLPDLETAPDAP